MSVTLGIILRDYLGRYFAWRANEKIAMCAAALFRTLNRPRRWEKS